jgi:hypothetical protein
MNKKLTLFLIFNLTFLIPATIGKLSAQADRWQQRVK